MTNPVKQRTTHNIGFAIGWCDSKFQHHQPFLFGSGGTLYNEL
jgi:hypothetical protein